MFVGKTFNPTIQKRSSEKGDSDVTVSDETTPLITPTTETKFSSKSENWLSVVTIEPIIFLQMFAIHLVQIISLNQFIDRICRVTMELPEDACANLTRNVESEEITSDVKIQVDGLASRFLMYRAVIESVTQIVISLFLGSWSDKHGRKILFVICASGYIVTSGLNVLLTYLPNLAPEYLLLASIPVAVTGGYTVLLLTSFSYIASVSTAKNRSVRYAFLEMSVYLGNPAGTFMGALIYKGSGFAGVYITEVGVLLMALIYAIVRIPDDSHRIKDSGNFCTELFNTAALKETFVSVFKKRENSKRMWIVLFILSLCLSMLTRFGPNNCMFLFTRFMFGWNEQEHSMLNTVDGILTMVGILLLSFGGLKLLKLEDSVAGLIASCGCLASNLVVAFVPGHTAASWLMYLAITFQMFGGMVSVPIRSMLSKIASGDELGKIFTFVACAQSIVPIFAGIMYSFIFISTEMQFPGAFSLLSAGFNFLIASTFAYCYFTRKKKPVLENIY
ncbi:unnamed protein product [Allacma fusca]|uniref:Proton-coupled folate transporter n=1 Tax=Allacma fusca TaxID=39272 RepID=A0A8J2PKS7_9HEXA|nr:unnamed protein product [Allacma fusca]